MLMRNAFTCPPIAILARYLTYISSSRECNEMASPAPGLLTFSGEFESAKNICFIRV